MDNLGARLLVQRLIDEQREKAVDLLVRFCQDKQVYNEITTCFLLPSGAAQQGAMSPTSKGFNITFGPPHPASPFDSQHSGSPPPHQDLPYRSSRARPFSPVSPPKTASSSISRSSRGNIVPREYIFLLNINSESGIEEKPVLMRAAQIQHSVMRHDVFSKRDLTAARSSAAGYRVLVPHLKIPERHIDVMPLFCARIEWRREHSDSTHSTMFFIVPDDVLDIDVLLGYEDSGEGQPNYPPTVAPQPQHPQSSILGEYHSHAMRQPAPSPPAASFHRSAAPMYDNSMRGTPVQEQQHPYSFLDSLIERQRELPAGVRETSRHSQHSPTNTVLGARSSHMEQHAQPLRPSPPIGSSSHGHHASQNVTPTNKIRLNFDWGPTPMNMWLEPRDSGETFFQAFQQVVEKRKGVFERSSITLHLKTDKKTPNDEAYALSLDADELEADWETTVEWLEENRRDKPPHIYGRVEVGEG